MAVRNETVQSVDTAESKAVLSTEHKDQEAAIVTAPEFTAQTLDIYIVENPGKIVPGFGQMPLVPPLDVKELGRLPTASVVEAEHRSLFPRVQELLEKYRYPNWQQKYLHRFAIELIRYGVSESQAVLLSGLWVRQLKEEVLNEIPWLIEQMQAFESKNIQWFNLSEVINKEEDKVWQSRDGRFERLDLLSRSITTLSEEENNEFEKLRNQLNQEVDTARIRSVARYALVDLVHLLAKQKSPHELGDEPSPFYVEVLKLLHNDPTKIAQMFDRQETFTPREEELDKKTSEFYKDAIYGVHAAGRYGYLDYSDTNYERKLEVFNARLRLLRHLGEIDDEPQQLTEAYAKYLELKDNSKTHQVFVPLNVAIEPGVHTSPLNTDVVLPGWPSGESLKALRERKMQVPQFSVPEPMTEAWRVCRTMLGAENIDPQEWYEWVLATKRLGLRGTAERHRNRRIIHSLGLTKSKKNLSTDWYEWSYTDQQEKKLYFRLPTQTEITTELKRRMTYAKREDGYTRARRCWGEEAIELGIIPWRYDTECRLRFSGKRKRKYCFEPTEVLSMYAETYQLMKQDYCRGGGTPNPESAIAEYHSSLMSIYSGAYYQAYKDYGHQFGSGDWFDELDGLLFLPSVLADNGFTKIDGPLIFLKLYAQLDDDLKELYAEEIQTAFRKVVQNSDMFTNLLYKSEEEVIHLFLTMGEKSAINAANGTELADRLTGIAVETYKKFPDHKARAVYSSQQVRATYYGVGPSAVWDDPDYFINPRTGELEPVEVREVLPGKARAMDRVHETFTPTVEFLAAHEGVAEVGSFMSAGEMVLYILVERAKLGQLNLAQMSMYLDQIIQIGAQLRGVDRATFDTLVSQLTEPLNFDNLSFEGATQLVWQSAGHLEREAVVITIIQATAAAWRISLRRVLGKIEDRQMAEYIETLMNSESFLEKYKTEEEAKEAAQERAKEYASLGITELRQKSISAVEEVKVRFKQATTSDEKAAAKQTLVETIQQIVEDCSAILAAHVDYNYSRTRWMQVVDQILGPEADLENSNGRIQCYCVQEAYILYEILKDVLEVFEEQSDWEEPLKISVCLEDEMHAGSVEEFLQKLRLKNFIETNRDSFTHYLIKLQLPQVEAEDKPGFLVIDQTEKKIRAVDGDKVKQSFEGEFVAELPTENGVSVTRFVDVVDPGLPTEMGIVGHMLEGIDSLEAMSGKLHRHPLSLFILAANTDKGAWERNQALTMLIRNYPYFVGENGLFVQSGTYYEQMTSLIELSAQMARPIITLFLANTLLAAGNYLEGVNQLEIEKYSLEMIDQALEIITYLPEMDWRIQLQTSGHLLQKNEMSKIVAGREQKRQIPETERQKILAEILKKIAQKTGDIAELTASIKIQAQEEADARRDSEPPTAGDARVVDATTQWINQAGQYHQLLYDDESPSLLPSPQEEGLTLHDASRKSAIQPTIRLADLAAVQSTHELLDGITDPALIENRVKICLALLRATVLEAQASLSEQAPLFEAHTTRIRAHLTSQGLPVLGLMSFKELMQLPHQELQIILQTRFSPTQTVMVGAASTKLLNRSL